MASCIVRPGWLLGPLEDDAGCQRKDKRENQITAWRLQGRRNSPRLVKLGAIDVPPYLRVLRETTDWLADPNRTGGPVGRLIDAAARSAEHLTVITFNHDLVIENAFRGTLRSPFSRK